MVVTMAVSRAPHPRVIQALQEASVPYEVRWHDECDRPIEGPADFAAALGYPIGRITKTLVVASPSTRLFGAVVLGRGRVEIASEDELAAATGYPRTGVSPLGLADGVPVVIDDSLTGFATVLVGAGVLGGEVELAPEDLRIAAHAMVARVAR